MLKSSYVLILNIICLLYSYSYDLPPPDSPILCRNNQHVMGQWIQANKTKKTYYVCGLDDYDVRYNKELCGWNHRSNEKLFYGHITWLLQSGGLAASCDARDNTKWNVTKRENYEWKPMLCELIPWNATQFCDLLDNRIILMIGDSTIGQTGAALVSRLTYDIPNQKSCSNNIAILRIDKISVDYDNIIKYIKEIQPDIIIFNTGAHFASMKPFHEEITIYFTKLYNEIHAISTKQVQLLWKTMNPGHINCSTQSNGELNIDWKYNSTNTEDKYHWNIFAQQDNYMKYYIPQHFNMKIIDMSPLYYRQDAHSDCLHYCLPGPVDVFGSLLLNMLYTKEV